MVLEATRSGDVPAEERKKLYAAMKRRDDLMPPEVLARWSADGTSNKKKFLFMKEWVANNCNFGRMKITEEHVRIAERKAEKTFR
jgi:hypothetical protein